MSFLPEIFGRNPQQNHMDLEFYFWMFINYWFNLFNGYSSIYTFCFFLCELNTFLSFKEAFNFMKVIKLWA